MGQHLLSIYHIDVNKDESEIEAKKMRTMDNFVVKTSLEEIVLKLAAVDGFSIRQITHSEFICQSLSLRRMKLPTDERSVMALIRDFEEKVKQQVIQDIKKELSESKRFSISLDEWTSIGNRQVLNINLHKVSSKCINLGLVEIYGSCNAERMNELAEQHIDSFGVSFKQDIVASTGDGASVRIKLGEKSPALYQACFDHGLHLGVTKTFYRENCPGEGISVFSGKITCWLSMKY